ncbi:fatty acid cis/trans isomerase [Thiogranum longum]|uniref:fatty acid cis/trans isomerase n=1 Tax=Thiogranum longum TaxID=1537524 RepID=UPI001401CFA6|nr:fatty acid cis/trans isomerase [Thiogranum longum]
MAGRFKTSIKTRVLVVTLLALLAGSLLYTLPLPQHDGNNKQASTDIAIPADLLSTPVDYEHQVRPVLERRCVVCHGCYDAPCQLKLSSHEGLQRGASEEAVYNPARIDAMQPTRLFVDAKSTAEWRSRGFHPVLNEGLKTPEQNLNNSVLYRLLKLKRQHPQPHSKRLPDNFTLGLNREQTCPALDAVDEFAEEHPSWGMPYAMPDLSEQEYQTLVSWLAQGARAPAPAGPSAAVEPQINRWEDFFNRTSRKQQLVSRYLYEHLFHAHIHFTDSPAREFYRLVRSRTPPGQGIDEIPTVRPYDDPGLARFYYRLRKYVPSIVVKNHIVYEFSGQRMQRYRELFLDPVYKVQKLPSYQPETASNPFKTFIDLPIKSRYRFLLDDAHFFVEGFIKGPVCRGQIALDVIEDRFWVMFFDPEQSVFTNDAQFVGKVADDLQLPSERRSSLDITSIWTDYWKRQRRYLETKQAMFEKINTHDIGHAMGYIWDGDGNNPNAALTVFRHFDSGSVSYGLAGVNPETAWIIDYPLFERIHYLLVAGYNVYGNLVHQVNTRVYMDFLRMEGEDYFLAFLPADRRKAIRDSWYSGLRTGVEELFNAPQAWLQVESVSGYRTDEPQQELYQYIKERVATTTQQAININRCGSRNCLADSTDTDSVRVDKAMNEIARIHGARLHAFPDVAYVRVRMDKPEQDLAYTLVRNNAYKNVSSFIADEHDRDRSDIDQDTMTVVNWLEGSYPNFFFSVPVSEIDAFARHCASVRTKQEFEAFVDKYGVRRTNTAFWELADWFQDELARKQPVRAGLLDLNRYQNR